MRQIVVLRMGGWVGRWLRLCGRLRWLLLRLLGRYFNDEPVRILLSRVLVNIFDVSHARLLQRKSSPANGAGEVLLASVGQLVPLQHPPQVEALITKVADKLFTLF